jgi:hypothetical protein
MTLKEIEADHMIRQANARTLEAIARAKGSWAKADELCRLDIDLLARSRELIARGRQRLGQGTAGKSDDE